MNLQLKRSFSAFLPCLKGIDVNLGADIVSGHMSTQQHHEQRLWLMQKVIGFASSCRAVKHCNDASGKEFLK